jgi:hypothetical protein
LPAVVLPVVLMALGVSAAAQPATNEVLTRAKAQGAGAGADSVGQGTQDAVPGPASQDTPMPHDGAPRWLDAVRAQRRALQERRRAQHQARRRAIDPVGTARQEALEQEFLRRRREMRDLIAQERWLFLNFGPWLTPLPSPPAGTSQPPADGPAEPQAKSARPETKPTPASKLPDWDNGWYFRGW